MCCLGKNLEKHHHEAKGTSYYCKNKEKVHGDVNIVETLNVATTWMKQPHGSRVTKKEKKKEKIQECSIWVQAKAVVDSVGATSKKIF